MITLKRRYVVITTIAVLLLAAASWAMSRLYISLHANLLAMLGLTLAGMVLMGVMWALFAIARRQTAESEARHRAMLEAIPDLMFRLSSTGEYLDVHAPEPARKLLAPGTRIGATVRETLPSLKSEHWQMVIQKALGSGTAQTLEYELSLPSGEHHFEARVVPFGSDQVVSVVRDITERFTAERAIRESERTFRAMFDQAIELIGAAKPDGTLFEINRAAVEMLNVDALDLIGKKIWDIPWLPHAPKSQAMLLEQFQAAAAQAVSGDHVQQTHVIEAADGETRVLDFAAGPVRDEAGNIDFLVARSHDITDRVRAETDLRASRQQLRRLSRRLIELQERERSHIARELHDHVGQALTAAKLNLAMIEQGSDETAIKKRAQDSISIVDDLLDEVRTLAFELRPPMLDDLGLVAALRWYTGRQAERAGIEADFRASASGWLLDEEAASACFRVAQEAIANALKHAEASNLAVGLKAENDECILTVTDDGSGFDADRATGAEPDPASMGIVGMHERVSLVGGSLTIESEPGVGTTVRASFPLHGTDPRGDTEERDESHTSTARG
jgi:PAS domain S-box-containing protein